MIESVIAVEFDNKMGTSIVASFPPRKRNSSDHVLVDYLLPEGMHLVERDHYIFRGIVAFDSEDQDEEIERFNQRRVMANLYVYRNNNKSLHDFVQISEENPFAFALEIVQKKFLRFAYVSKGQQKSKMFVLHRNLDMRQLSDRLYTLRAEDETIFLVEFKEKSDGNAMNSIASLLSDNLLYKNLLNINDEHTMVKSGWFYCLCASKRDPSADRGVVYRSLAIFSPNTNIFEYFKGLVSKAMESFLGMVPKPRWQDFDVFDLQTNLEHLFNQCNSIMQPQYHSSLCIHPQKMINPLLSPEVHLKLGVSEMKLKVYPKLFGSSSKLLVDVLGPSVMVIYRAILAEENVIFYGEKQKVERICSIVCSTLNLLCPLNIVSKLFPFEHLQGINILQNTKGYIAGFTNPIIKTSKSINWNIMIDLYTGAVLDRSMKPAPIRNENDRLFVEVLIKKIKEDSLLPEDVDKIFYDYTKTNIDLMLNRSSIIRFDREDEETMQKIFKVSDEFKATRFFETLDVNMKNEREEFQSVYYKKYLGVYQAFKFLVESEKIADIDLIVCLEALRVSLVEQEKIDFFLKKLIEKQGSLEILTVGLLSEDANVREINKKLVSQLEVSNIWADYNSNSNLFMTLLMSQSTS